MMKIMAGTSALIVAVMVIRRLFRKKLSQSFRYALWLAVAVQVIMTASAFPQSPFSIWNLGRAADRLRPAGFDGGNAGGGSAAAEAAAGLKDAECGVYLTQMSGNENGYGQTSDEEPFSAVIIADRIALARYTGTALILLLFTACNAWLYYCLKRMRRDFSVPYGIVEKYPGLAGIRNLKTYQVKRLPSPCILGKSVYLPEKKWEVEELAHVLAHEYAHRRQKDEFWLWLSRLCLALQWYNPFVWAAAVLSRQDAETACDERSIEILGEPERFRYGETLLNFVPVRTGLAGRFGAGVSMVGGTCPIKYRLQALTHKLEGKRSAAITAAVILAVLTGCTGTDAPDAHAETDAFPVSEETTIEALTETKLQLEAEIAVLDKRKSELLDELKILQEQNRQDKIMYNMLSAELEHMEEAAENEAAENEAYRLNDVGTAQEVEELMVERAMLEARRKGLEVQKEMLNKKLEEIEEKSASLESELRDIEKQKKKLYLHLRKLGF